MGRKVGSFTNPKTGSEDWLDVSTVKHIKLAPLPTRVHCKNEIMPVLIDFLLDNDDEAKTVILKAVLKNGEKTVESNWFSVDELDFAETLADCVYNEKELDETEMMSDLKKQAFDDLKSKLLFAGFLLEESVFAGAGYVMCEKSRVMTVDGLAIKNIDGSAITFELINCVGNAKLSNLIDPHIEFWTEAGKITTHNITVLKEGEGRVRNYLIQSEYVSVCVDEPIKMQYEPFEKVELDLENDASVERFVQSRQKMLNTTEEAPEDILGDWFLDLF